MSDDEDIHDDIREIRTLVTENLAKTVSIERAIWPDPGQDSILTQHNKRISALEDWRNYLIGAWAVISSFVTVHIFRGHQ